MTRFDPSPGDEIRLGGATYRFEGHPAAPWTVYAAEGRKAIVYRLRSKGNKRIAFKVFKGSFRGPHLLEGPRTLRPLRDLEGLKVARRAVVDPSSKLAERHPETAFAVIMPWIDAPTWSDLLMRAARREGHLDPSASLRLSLRFLDVLRGLESRSAAHTDVAAGNVAVSPQSGDVELLDVEDVYLPNRQPPQRRPCGSAGYQHPSLKTGGDCWCPEGDRFAAAILAAELILLSDRDLALHACEDGLLQDNRDGLFEDAVKSLRRRAPGFGNVFLKAWESPDLGRCPQIAELVLALRPVAPAAAPTRGWIETVPSRHHPQATAETPVKRWRPILVSWRAGTRTSPTGRPGPPPSPKALASFRPYFLLSSAVLGFSCWAGTGEPTWLALILLGLTLDLLRTAVSRRRAP